jgi:hypothetical protein
MMSGAAAADSLTHVFRPLATDDDCRDHVEKKDGFSCGFMLAWSHGGSFLWFLNVQNLKASGCVCP